MSECPSDHAQHRHTTPCTPAACLFYFGVLALSWRHAPGLQMLRESRSAAQLLVGLHMRCAHRRAEAAHGFAARAQTVVAFTDAWGRPEEGVDEGGLTAEMYAHFWREVVKPEARLFEQARYRRDTGGRW